MPASSTVQHGLQLCVQISRESETTASHSVNSGASSSTLAILPPRPAPTASHPRRQSRDDALTDFFGGRGQRVRAEQQQQQRQPRQHRSPPPYSPDWDGEKLPAYAPSSSEPDTVARQLFKYGFFFPLFWAIGVYFMFAPMRVSPDWEQGKTEEEKAKILSDMRQTEMKWAKRCLWALLSFFVCMILVIIAVVVSRRH